MVCLYMHAYGAVDSDLTVSLDRCLKGNTHLREWTSFSRPLRKGNQEAFQSTFSGSRLPA